MFKYIKYLTNNVVIGMTVVGFMLGGHWMWLGFFFVIVGAVGGDFVFGEHGEAPKYKYPQFLNLIMYSYFPVIVGATLVFIWTMTPGGLLGIGAAVAWLTGYDAVAGKVGNHFFDLVGGALVLGPWSDVSDYQRDHGTRINPPDLEPGSDVFRALVFCYVGRDSVRSRARLRPS